MGNKIAQQPLASKPQSIVVRRTQKSYHNLFSPRDLHKDFTWKKWRYCCIDQAQEQLRKLHAKISNPVDCVIAVQDVEFTKTSNGVFNVRAKVQFTERNLRALVEEKRVNNRSFSLGEIWGLATQICEIALYACQKKQELPENLGNYFIFGNKIKIKDSDLLPEIIVEKNTPKPQAKTIIARIVGNLALLTLQMGNVSIYEINRINLKYNANLATFVYCLQEQDLAIGDICRLCQNLRHENKETVYKSATIGLGQNGITNQQNICLPLKNKLQNLKIGGKCIKKSTSEHILATNTKRIQQIRPKNIGKIGLSQQKINKNTKLEHENKENKDQNISRATKSIKQSLDIQNHCFPKKLKHFKRISTTMSQLYESKNPDSKNSSARNEAFIKMTNGSKCQLFATDQNDQLLESIIESEESIIIKNNESPLLSLDQEMDQIAQDFLKLENSFNAAQKQEVKSVMEFVYQRNSTIMEVTQQNEDSANNQHIKQSRIQEDPSDISNFQISENVEQKFVIEEYEGGSRYEGYILNGLRNGFGKLYYQDGGSYEGSWKHGEIEGFGKLYYQSGDLAYEGYWLQGEFHGEGKIINEKPDQIKGAFNFTDFSEVGTAWIWYEGNFEHDHKNGSGTLMLSNGESLTGTWSMNNVQGQGVFVTLEKIRIRGKWVNNVLEQMYQEEMSQSDGLQIL